MADTPVTGQMLIADEPVRGSGQRIRAFESAADREIELAYAYGDASHVDAACAAAAAAIGDYRSTTAEQRARFLETNASKHRVGHGRRRRTGRHRERAAAGAPHRRGRPHHRPATPVRRRPAQSPATPMLTPGIADAYAGGVTGLSGEADLIAHGETGDSRTACRAALFATDVDSFLTSHTLQAEVFGSSSLIVRCAGTAEMRTVAENIGGGQLTATGACRRVRRRRGAAASAVARVEGGPHPDGWPTGVEVCHAMVHGGPSPATSDSRTTSVGARAIERSLRPVCYQNAPNSLLPSVIADGNPDGLWRRVDGRLQLD